MNQAIRLRDTGIGRAIRAEVRAIVTLDTGNTKDADNALLDVAVAKDKLPNHPYVLFASVYASVAAAHLYENSPQPQRRIQILEEAQRDATALESYVHLTDPAYGLWCYWGSRGEERKILEKLGPVAERSNVPLLLLIYGLTLYRDGEAVKAFAILGQAKNVYQVGVDILRAFVAAELKSEITPGIEIYEEAMKRYRTRDDLMALQTVLLGLGQTQRALSASREISRRAPPNPKFWRLFSDSELKYRSADLSDEELIRLAANSRADQGSAFFLIGLTRLAEGDRASAREFFQKVIAWPGFGWGYHDLSWVFLKRLERDPNWPPWIPVKNSEKP